MERDGKLGNGSGTKKLSIEMLDESRVLCVIHSIDRGFLIGLCVGG